MAAERTVHCSFSGDPFEQAESCRQDGNAALSKGDFADAVQRYDEGLLALVRCPADDAKRADEARAALHLNAALAHIRRGTLKVAMEHASEALSLQPESVKALYRRGLARSQLSEHPGYEAETKLALADFERALELDPANSDVKQQLQSLRQRVKTEKKQVADSLKSSFQGKLAGGKPIFKEVQKSKLAPVTHSCAEQEDHLALISAEALEFAYERGQNVLQNLSIELRESWCVGLVGNNGSGKTTLVRLLKDKLRPAKGVIVHTDLSDAATSSPVLTTAVSSVAALAVLIGVCSDAWQEASKESQMRMIAFVIGGSLLLIAVALYFRVSRGVGSRHFVLHATSDIQEREHIADTKPIDTVIGEALPKTMSAEMRRAKVIAMLRAAAFQMYNQTTGEPTGNPEEYVRDGLKFGQLSGGQRHLIYILRCFAQCPDVLLCDELLGGLDATRQPRVLHMINRLKKEAGVAVLFVATELHQLRLVADTIGFLSDGEICELGPTHELLDFPKHPATKHYISHYRGLPGGEVIGGKLAQNFAAVADNEDLLGPWLPMEIQDVDARESRPTSPVMSSEFTGKVEQLLGAHGDTYKTKAPIERNRELPIRNIIDAEKRIERELQEKAVRDAAAGADVQR